MMFEYGFFAGYTADHLTAVSARGAPADLVRLDDVHVVTTLREVQCRGYAGESCAYYTQPASRCFVVMDSSLLNAPRNLNEPVC